MNRVMIAAAASGSGKTLITCGLLELLKQLNMKPISYKCGPDYIDPMFHRKVLGISGGNLDSFFSSKEDLIRTINDQNYEITEASDHKQGKIAETSDHEQGKIAVVEGVMGIYDGFNVENNEGSSYSIAEITDTPIVLVVDAKGSGRTIISIIKGILADDTAHLIKGIILNRMSEYFYKKLWPVLENELFSIYPELKLLGFIPKIDGINLDSRHLGLKLPDEIEGLKLQIVKLAETIKMNCDIDALVEIATSANEPDTGLKNKLNSNKMTENLVLAVARDDAFCFYYKENIKLFEELGVKIVQFSPMNDIAIPKCDGVLLGGGYPELHLKQLSNNKPMLSHIKQIIETGIPSLAECGGFMYLHNAIIGEDGESYPMVGVIDGECTNQGRLVRFGYIELSDNVNLTGSGNMIINEKTGGIANYVNHIGGMKAHEFHYYDSSCNGNACVATKPDGSKSWECIISDGVSYWGFPHMYYRSKPEFIYKFVENMMIYKEKSGKADE